MMGEAGYGVKIRDVLREQDFHFKKRWGQNFIFDLNLLRRIVAEAGIGAGDSVVEIGPGAGTLTWELLEKGAQVLAIEIDPALLPVLEKVLEGTKGIVVQGDALKINFDEMAAAYGLEHPYKVVANLPYYITTPLIMSLLENRYHIEDIVVMVQKEVAERLTASPGTKEYGAVTLAVEYYAETVILFPVSRQLFRPIPEVDSALLRLKPRKAPLVQVCDEELLFKIIKAAFGQRRKTLVNSLAAIEVGLVKIKIMEVLENAGINQRTRGEALSLAQFAQLTNLWAKAMREEGKK